MSHRQNPENSSERAILKHSLDTPGVDIARRKFLLQNDLKKHLIDQSIGKPKIVRIFRCVVSPTQARMAERNVDKTA